MEKECECYEEEVQPYRKTDYKPIIYFFYYINFVCSFFCIIFILNKLFLYKIYMTGGAAKTVLRDVQCPHFSSTIYIRYITCVFYCSYSNILNDYMNATTFPTYLPILQRNSFWSSLQGGQSCSSEKSPQLFTLSHLRDFEMHSPDTSH